MRWTVLDGNVGNRAKRCFVIREQRMEKWYVAAKRADFSQISRKFGIDQVTARIIRNRGVVGDEAIGEYLHGTPDRLYPASLLGGCREAAVLLKKKIEEKKKIRIIGDYDIDGVNATYILYRGLQRLGAAVDFEIPDRMKDGYGLNIQLVETASREGADTILTCDNGITAIEQTAYAKSLGMTVIITDHHEPLFEETDGERRWNLPEADVLIDPKLPDSGYPFPKLCGASVAWKLIQMLYEVCGVPKEWGDGFLPFAAIATVGDVMDLQGENRIIVKWGLRALEQTDNPGLRALIRETGLEHSPISAYHIGFVLGPCINASGRLDTAKRSLRLLLAEDPKEAETLASELKQLNEERKDLTAKGVEAAVEMIEHSDLKKDRVLVVYLPDCHESIAGIVAGRIRERYYKPVFVLTDGEACVKGSGRSIETYSMFEEMVKCQDLFLKFGGHPMAAGLSLEKERVPEFRRRINEQCQLTGEDLTERVVIDVPMPIDYISEKLIRELSVLEPFGKGNEKPLFAEKDLEIETMALLGKNRNVLKMTVCNSRGTSMEAMYFGDVEKFQAYVAGKYGRTELEKLFQGRQNQVRLSFTYYPVVHEFRDRKTLQIVIQNYQ